MSLNFVKNNKNTVFFRFRSGGPAGGRLGEKYKENKNIKFKRTKGPSSIRFLNNADFIICIQYCMYCLRCSHVSVLYTVRYPGQQIMVLKKTPANYGNDRAAEQQNCRAAELQRQSCRAAEHKSIRAAGKQRAELQKSRAANVTEQSCRTAVLQSSIAAG